MTKWDDRFIRLAADIGKWSKDRSRGTGCVIVGPNKEIRSTGYNGFPRGTNDEVEERHTRPAKYLWTEHAERNAICNAARIGVSLDGCTMYLHWYPCMDCARAIIQSGIIELVAVEPDWNDANWSAQFAVVRELFDELTQAGLFRVRFVAMP